MSGVTKLMTAGGGGVALTPASSIASDVTVNVPSSNGTLVSTGETAQVSQAMLAAGVAGNGPAFRAYQSTTQSNVGNVTFTKVALQTETFDTNSCFDTTNYRFTPTVAGYYSISGAIKIPYVGGGVVIACIYKNGAIYAQGGNGVGSTGIYAATTVTSIVYMNGSTDYVELYTYGTNGGGNYDVYATSDATYFQGVLVRAA